MYDNDNDELLFLDEDSLDSPEPQDANLEPWHLLIVDDEDQVHQATRYALNGQQIFGRRLELHSAHSAAQARQLLRERRFACVLLDVVMESEDAGLKLVSHIREELGDTTVRIILRTGQPGYAPELEVIHRYDINDYKCKSELTRNRLITTLTAALRCYQQIRTIEANREGLEIILEAASSLMAVQAVNKFAQGVLIQICGMLQIEREDGILCAHCLEDDPNQLRVLAASGRFADSHGKPLEQLHNPAVLEDVHKALTTKTSFFSDDRAVLYIHSPHHKELVVHVSTSHPLSELDKKLLEIFSVNIAVGFDNAHLFQRLEHLAFRDNLTGLPNRAAFEQELGQRLKQASALILVTADIDNFQAVNDGLGHEIGDKTLQTCAQVLRELFGPEPYMARTSADSFTLILPDMDAASLDGLLRRVTKYFERNLRVDEHEIPLTMSLGVARYPEHGATAPLLFQNVGIALKQAKRANRSSFEIFNRQLEQDLQTRLDTIRELRHSVERRCLKLFYQPQVNLKSKQVFGVEALVRWQRDPDHLVPPNLFIPAAEDSGHIIAMGEWILHEACRQHEEWRHRHGLALQMAVNVSMRQLKDPNFLSMVRDVLRQTSVDPRMIELEVTESMMMEDTQGLIEVLRNVRSLGMRVAIDDFGTGYSSLSHLQKLPIDRLKIDRSFITGLTQHTEDQVIAALVINMGHLLNLRVIAEGVETAEQEARLIQMGCDDVQGYYYGKPMPADQLIELVRQRNG